MNENDSITLTPLGVSVLDAFIDAYMKKHPEITSRDEAKKRILEEK